MRTCSVTGCDRAVSARTLCKNHYQQAQYWGMLGEYPRFDWDAFHTPSIIPVGWVPPDAGQPMPYSASLRLRLEILEGLDRSRDAWSESRYEMTFDGERWVLAYRREAAA